MPDRPDDARRHGGGHAVPGAGRMTAPTCVLPETPEQRAATTQRIEAATGLKDETLETMVRLFYARARTDAVIGHLFNGVEDWEWHVAQITAFWSSVGLMTGRYHGQPMPAHAKLPLEPHHFARWLVLFEETLDELCTDAGKAHLMDKARRIAASLQVGVSVARGSVPKTMREAG